MSKTLYISDLDGTLMQPDARLSDRAVNLINKAIEQGKLFSIATARTPATVAGILSKVNMRLPAIVITGGALWNQKTGEYSRVNYFDSAIAKKLIDIYRTSDTSTFMFSLIDNMIDIYHLCGKLQPLQQQFYDERAHSPYKRFHLSPDGSDIIPENLDYIILFYTMLPDAKASSTYQLIKDIPGVKAQYYHDIYGPEIGILEAFPPEATKANAVRALAREYGADRIVCFGDNINDIPMLEVADTAIAVENALPEVKRVADIVIGPNTEDSVAKFIYED